MATAKFSPENMRKTAIGSPRPKGRENAKDTLCRNVLIYGHCRYEEQGCAFNHDPNKTQADAQKKSLNVDSPSFTPTILARNNVISQQAASAAPFTPRGLGSRAGTPNRQQQESETGSINVGASVFTPQNYDMASTGNGSALDTPLPVSFDPFSMTGVSQAVPSAQYNPYLEDNNSMSAGAAYFQAQSAYAPSVQPLQYHLYAPRGPHREDLLAYQRHAHDFFMPDNLREDLQRKAEASLQVMPNSQLPTLDNYHSLVALDTRHDKNATIFGYPSWVYKATSSKNGNLYCLRRLEGYRLTNEKAIRSVKDWRRIDSAGVVTVHDAFTTRAFGDSSLIFVTDYHPLSKTLVEHHFSRTRPTVVVPEPVLWGYVVQISLALKDIHSTNLAARCIDPSKVILTDKNRIRLNACAILDVVKHDEQRPVLELQQEDIREAGKLILSLATNIVLTSANENAALDQMSRSYSAELYNTVHWLRETPPPGIQKTVNAFIQGISTHVATFCSRSLQAEDTLHSELSRELENGRLARLMMKLGTINERPEYDGDRHWSENGERYMLKLFRDYVFHQVDAGGAPVIDLGHIIRCLNKLDAGVDEKILLTSRDEQTTFVVTYKELKKQVAAAFTDLSKSTKSTRT